MGGPGVSPQEVEGGAEAAVAADCSGSSFWELDPELQGLLALYLPDDLHRHLLPRLERMGELAGGELDRLARTAERHPPVLHPRDARGRDEEWIEYHPAYREMERIAYLEMGLHAMGHRGGVLDWPEPLPAIAKYAFQYLFTQGEFGLMCPVSLTDTSAWIIERFGDETLRSRLLPGLCSQDPTTLLRGAQWMTERPGGSDVGRIELQARREADGWRLWGEKWFCSSADAEVALVLARPQGAAPGTRGLALFALTRHLPDGRRNRYRIVRLKDKLGTRSMASGEIVFEGALAHPVGRAGPGENPGLRQVLAQVNLSRLSHGVRAAAMMRRCYNEALAAARSRVAFGAPIIERPLLARQLAKLRVPTEQALTMSLLAARELDRARAGEGDAETRLRLLTPLLKYRACRDNVPVATGSMEIRGGNGYIEEWVNPRLIRDAQVGLLWEGTSNINALDVTTRAIRKARAHEALREEMHALLERSPAVPGQLRGELAGTFERASELARRVADEDEEPLAREAASALYHATSAIVLAAEGARLGEMRGDARRVLVAAMVLRHRLGRRDPLAPPPGAGRREMGAVAALLDDAPVSPRALPELLG